MSFKSKKSRIITAIIAGAFLVSIVLVFGSFNKTQANSSSKVINLAQYQYNAKNPPNTLGGGSSGMCASPREGWTDSTPVWVCDFSLPLVGCVIGHWEEVCLDDIDNPKLFSNSSSPSSPVGGGCVCNGSDCGSGGNFYTGVMVSFDITESVLPNGISIEGSTGQDYRCSLNNNENGQAFYEDASGVGSGATCNTDFNSGVISVANFNYPNANEFKFGNNILRCEGGSAGSSEYSQIILDKVTLYWDAPTHNLAVDTQSGLGSGSVISSPASIDCGVICEADYAENTTITLTATPDNSSSEFSGWIGCNSVSGNQCTVVMNSNKSVSARFDLLYPSVVSGAVRDQNGVVIEGASMAFTGTILASDTTDSNGNYFVTLSDGIYMVAIAYSQNGSSGTLMDNNFIVNGNTYKDFVLNLNQPTVSLTGKTVLPNNQGVSAFVWAWSDSGDFVETQSAFDGSYSLDVYTNDVWHIGAATDESNKLYRQRDKKVNVADSDVAVEDITVWDSGLIMVNSVVQTDATDSSAFVVLDDNMSVKIPKGAVDTGSIKTTIVPVSNTPSYGYNNTVVGFAYDINIKDDSDIDITDFDKDLLVSLPYSDEKLTEAGVNDEDLTMVYWDDAVERWIPVSGYVVDKLNNLVVGRVDHLTRFAIVAPSDTTPPSAPTSVSITSKDNDSLTLAWLNPVADFHHIKIYRSTTLGNIGLLVFDDVTVSVLTDSGLSADITYYYTIRAVDVAGNESTNITQYLGTPGGGTVSSSEETLIRLFGNPKVYIIENSALWSESRKHWVPSVAVFDKLQLNWSNIDVVDQDTFNSYPQVKLLRGDGSTIFYLTDFGMIRHIPNPVIFESYGYLWNDVFDVIPDEIAAYSLNDLILAQNDYRVYKLEAGKKRWIETAEAFLANGFRWDEIAIVNQLELDFYPEGEKIVAPGVNASITCQDSDSQPNDCVTYSGENFILVNESVDSENSIIKSSWSITGAKAYSFVCPPDNSNPVCDFSVPNLIPGFYTANLTARNNAGIDDFAIPRDFQINKDIDVNVKCSLDNVDFVSCSTISLESNEAVYFSGKTSTPSEGAIITDWSWSFPATATVLSPLNKSTAKAKFTEDSNQILLNASDNANRASSVSVTVKVKDTLSPQQKETMPR